MKTVAQEAQGGRKGGGANIAVLAPAEDEGQALWGAIPLDQRAALHHREHQGL